MASFLRSSKTKLEHTSKIPVFTEFKQLANLIGSEKNLLNSHARAAADCKKAATALDEWTQTEGPDLIDTVGKIAKLLANDLAKAEEDYSEHLQTYRMYFKALRSREEKFSTLKKNKDSLQSKIDATEKKLAKMSPEHKDLHTVSQKLAELRSDMVAMEHAVMTEEAAIGDFRRQTARSALAHKLAAICQLGEKMTIIGELGKLLAAEIRLDRTEPGHERGLYNSYDRTQQIYGEAQTCLHQVLFDAGTADPAVQRLPVPRQDTYDQSYEYEQDQQASVAEQPPANAYAGVQEQRASGSSRNSGMYNTEAAHSHYAQHAYQADGNGAEAAPTRTYQLADPTPRQVEDDFASAVNAGWEEQQHQEPGVTVLPTVEEHPAPPAPPTPQVQVPVEQNYYNAVPQQESAPAEDHYYAQPVAAPPPPPTGKYQGVSLVDRGVTPVPGSRSAHAEPASLPEPTVASRDYAAEQQYSEQQHAQQALAPPAIVTERPVEPAPHHQQAPEPVASDPSRVVEEPEEYTNNSQVTGEPAEHASLPLPGSTQTKTKRRSSQGKPSPIAISPIQTASVSTSKVSTPVTVGSRSSPKGPPRKNSNPPAKQSSYRSEAKYSPGLKQDPDYQRSSMAYLNEPPQLEPPMKAPPSITSALPLPSSSPYFNPYAALRSPSFGKDGNDVASGSSKPKPSRADTRQDSPLGSKMGYDMKAVATLEDKPLRQQPMVNANPSAATHKDYSYAIKSDSEGKRLNAGAFRRAPPSQGSSYFNHYTGNAHPSDGTSSPAARLRDEWRASQYGTPIGGVPTPAMENEGQNSQHVRSPSGDLSPAGVRDPYSYRTSAIDAPTDVSLDDPNRYSLAQLADQSTAPLVVRKKSGVPVDASDGFSGGNYVTRLE